MVAAWRARHVARYLAYGAGGVTSIAAAQAAYLRVLYVPPDEPNGQREGRAGPHFTGQPLHLLFVGDSLCMGVGARRAAPFQAACAERLAQEKRVPVVWRTIAQNGADVRELDALLVQAGGEESRTAAPSSILGTEGLHISLGGTKGFHIAVVMCGVNDYKKFFQGRWPSVFREDLSALCARLRKEAPDGRIVLPRIPAAEYAPALQQWPMRLLTGLILETFEGKKEEVGREPHVHSPTPSEDCFPDGIDSSCWSVDGMHPNDGGYSIMGDWLGSALASSLSIAE